MSDSVTEDRPILMVRPHLDDIPEADIPNGFYLTPLTGTANADTWMALIRAAEVLQTIPDGTFAHAYGSDEQAIRERVYFLRTEDGTPVATVAAWYGAGERADWGRIHWIYILPEYQGKGLGKALLSFAMNRLRQFGNERVYLRTSTGRPAAVHLYRSYGFIETE